MFPIMKKNMLTVEHLAYNLGNLFDYVEEFDETNSNSCHLIHNVPIEIIDGRYLHTNADFTMLSKFNN